MLAWLVLLGLPALGGTVVLDGETWHEYADLKEIEPKEHGHGPAAVQRDVLLTWSPDDQGLVFRATWRITAQKPGWFDGQLVGPGVHVSRAVWDGDPAALSSDDSGTRLTGQVDGPATVIVEGLIPGDPTRGELGLSLLPAVGGSVRVEAGDLVGEVAARDGSGIAREGDRFWTGAGELAVALVTRSADLGTKPTIAIGHAGVGLTVGEAEVTGKARLEWVVRQGVLDRVAFRATGVGTDLDVTGSSVRTWRRVGDRVEVELNGPERQRVAVDVSWSVPVQNKEEQRVDVPALIPEAFRVDRALQVARDGELDVVPELTGWQPTPAADLPSWGEGLVLGTPTAAYLTGGSASGDIGLYKFVPVSGPPTVVDVASYTMALNADGHMLARAYYQVRNERGSHLRIVPPPGLRIVGVRVGNEPANPVTDGSDGWLVPLLRSVETVEGLLSFPVEVVLVGDTGIAWDKRMDTAIRLPTVDAPVAVNRVTLVLPAEYQSKLDVGERGVVADFTEGESIDYGFAVGDEAKAAEADALFQEAVGSWMANEFEDVEETLEELRSMGASNENIQRLESNLRMLEEDEEDDDGDVALSRRVKAQASARADKDRRLQDELLREAEMQELSGDYAQAEASYRQALDLGGKLEKLEQTEEVEQERLNVELEAKFKQVQEKKKTKEAEVSRYARSSASTSKTRDQLARAAKEDPAFGEFEAGLLGDTGVGTGGGATAPVGAEPGTMAGLDGSDDRLVVSNQRIEIVSTPNSAVVIDDIDVTGRSFESAVMGAASVDSPPPANDPEPEPVEEPEMMGFSGDYWEDELNEATTVSETVTISGRRGPQVRIPNPFGGAKKAPPEPKADKPAEQPPRPEPATTPPPAKGSASMGMPSPFRKRYKEPKARGGKSVNAEMSSATSDDRSIAMGQSSGEGEDFAAHAGADNSYAFEPMEVTTTALSVVVPRLGEEVLYQHTLLAAGAETSVTVRAKRTPRNRRFR